MSRALLKLGIAVAIAAATVLAPRPATAYSVLAHETNIDAVWDTAIAPMLRHRYPGMTSERLVRARAFAYGGSLIQDLGYYPFGNRFFTNLVHYTRTGDFVEALIREASDPDEYAFALGALAHYSADNAGHPIAVNRAVPMIYPRLREKFGDEVTYEDSPSRHAMVEFSFDVTHVAGGAYVLEAYHDFVGFEVSKPVLERAFLATYGIELDDLFLNLDLAIGSYRFAVGKLIPEATRVAWREKREQILKLTPGVQQSAFVYTLNRRDYEKAFGTTYQKPGFLGQLLAIVFKILPKIGPLRPLAFKAATPEAEKLFAESLAATRQRYRASLQELASGKPLNLVNTNFDTGRASQRGEYALADETYADLVDKLASHNFANVSRDLRRDIDRFYATNRGSAPASRKARRREEKVSLQLAQLRQVPN